MRHPQLSHNTLEQLLLAELENNWLEVDTLIREQGETKTQAPLIRQLQPKAYI